MHAIQAHLTNLLKRNHCEMTGLPCAYLAHEDVNNIHAAIVNASMVLVILPGCYRQHAV